MDLPLGLVTALESGNCVLFVGAGIGHNVTAKGGGPAPGATELAKRLATRYGLEPGPDPDLAKVSQVVEIRKGREQLLAFLKTELEGLEPDEDLRWLLSLTWRAIFTTNYDSAIERCYELNADPTQTPIVIATNSEAKSYDPHFEVPVFHLHGSLFTEGGRGAVLVTEQDYATFRDRRSMLFEVFRYQYATTPILYVGYSHNDPNWRMVTAELRAEFGTASPPPSFRLTPDTPELDREILFSQGVTTIDGDLGSLRQSAEARLGDIRVDPSRLAVLGETVPSELRDTFAEHPAALTRLLNRWSYVNQEEFSATPNTADFLKGSPPNWALVGQGINFERDLEAPLVEEILDFATEPAPGPRSRIILGPAGYGMTTLLMAVAAWSSINRAATVLYLKSGAEPTDADVEFAITHLPSPTILVMDNASDHAAKLSVIWERIRIAGTHVFLLLGDRLNEWRQRRPSLRPREYPLDALSDDEIWGLLASLERAGALGRLASLSEELRFADVKVRNRQELLVTMREVTEGKAFDAIVEDEFRNIANDTARDFYGLVCAFSRVRGLVRDVLAADVLQINVGELYNDVVRNTEGIVRIESADDARGINVAAARHHVIADIVWRRCIDRLRREELLLRALKDLNLSYGVDVQAFEHFARDDDTVDGLNSMESKMRFFEAACRKDPTNAYVRQHYARMLRREGSFELALGQIDRAISMSPKSRVLLHTKGVILRDMALEATGAVEFGRRRLAQSEAAFESALKLDQRDEYSHQGLAELYLRWAKLTASTMPRESVAYVAKAEEAIRNGLRVARQREGLYIVSSELERHLGDVPASIGELRKALDEAPHSLVARYLLGTALRKVGDLEEAAAVLVGGLQTQPEDPRLARAYALTLREQGKPYVEAISVLRLATRHGLQDADFICVFGGMLAMSGEISESEEVWRRAKDVHWTVNVQNRIGYEPNAPEDIGRWVRGRVAKVGGGYIFVAVSGLPDFFCPSFRYKNTRLGVDEPVELRPGFCVRGPIAVEVRPVPQLVT